MEWVAIDVSIAGDPGVHRMAAALKVRVPEIVGLLGLTFAGMAQHAQDGQLGGVTDTLLEQWAHWHGKRGAFAKQFRAELCDDTGLVTAWEKFNGAHIRRAKAASARTKAWREKHERERTERDQIHAPATSPNANGNAHVTHNSTHNVSATVCGTGQDKTEPTTKSKEQEPSPRTAGAGKGKTGRPTWLTPYGEVWREKFGGELPWGPAADALAPLRKEWGEDETLRRWKNYIATATAQYVNPARFASTWNRWNHAADIAPRNGAKPSAAEQMAASMQRVFSGALPSGEGTP